MASFKERHHYAWRGSGQRWDAAGIGIIGGLLGGLAIWLLGIKVPQTILDNPFWGGVIAISFGAIVGAAFMYAVRLCWSSFHFRLEPLGGFRKATRATLGDNMWPVILMLSGIACFALFFGAGIVMFAMNQTKPRELSAPCKAANSEYNVTKRLQAIDEIYAQLAGPMSDLQNQAGMLLNSFNSRVLHSTAIPDLLAYHERAGTVFEQFNKTFTSYDYFRDIYNIMIAAPSNFAYTSTKDASENLAHELQRLGNLDPNDVLQNARNSRQMSAWETAVYGTATWITQKQDALRAKRREIEATEICRP